MVEANDYTPLRFLQWLLKPCVDFYFNLGIQNIVDVLSIYFCMDSIYTNIAYNPEIPPPVAFCCWKHHLKWIIDGITGLRSMPDGFGVAENVIGSIGGSLLDMYVGDMLPVDIASEILNHPLMCRQLNSGSFTEWILQDGKNYRCLTISDGSRWTLRVGNYPGRYVHIHPGRNSAQTFRFRSANLRVAIAFRLLFGWDETDYSKLMLNKARELVKLPPLGGKVDFGGTVNVLEFMRVKKN